MDLDPLPQPEVQIPSGPGESRWNPSVWSIHIEHEEDEYFDQDFDE
jgi:hypothetical protein